MTKVDLEKILPVLLSFMPNTNLVFYQQLERMNSVYTWSDKKPDYTLGSNFLYDSQVENRIPSSNYLNQPQTSISNYRRNNSPKTISKVTKKR